MALRLKQIREQRDISQGEVAAAIGCTVPTYSRYETGSRQPSIDILIQLSDFFDVSVDYLIGRNRVDPSALSDYEVALIEASRETNSYVREDVLDFLIMKNRKSKQ